jgi:hypothetical protein
MTDALPHVGQRVVLADPHPWAGYRGWVIRVESIRGRPARVVRLDTGHHVGLLEPDQWRPGPLMPRRGDEGDEGDEGDGTGS